MRRRIRRAGAGRRTRTRAAGLGVTRFVLAGAGTGLADFWGTGPHDNPWPYANPGAAPVLAVVGDIACQPGNPVATAGTTNPRSGARPPAGTPSSDGDTGSGSCHGGGRES